jgi:ketosteroid isomerase-like protein
VTLDFLRAKQAQGVALKFALGETRQINASRRAVSVRVNYPQPGTPANSEVRLQVQIEKDDQGRWRITRVTGDN